jgi:dipeptidyl-peptidase-4
MDLGRVGIFGHSFGGYMGALAVLRRPDVYRAGVASAPVADWLDYDTFYTERYLGVPDKDTSIYDANGLIKYAKDLSRPLLIVHGTADDNVFFVHSLKLADALFKAGKSFDFVPLARQTHLIRDPKVQLAYWDRIFSFFRQNL